MSDVPVSAAGTYDPVYDGCGNWPFNIAYATEHGLQGWVERLGACTTSSATSKPACR